MTEQSTLKSHICHLEAIIEHIRIKHEKAFDPFNIIYQEGIKGRFEKLGKEWNEKGEKWLKHMSGGLCDFRVEMDRYIKFSELSGEEQYAFAKWVDEERTRKQIGTRNKLVELERKEHEKHRDEEERCVKIVE